MRTVTTASTGTATGRALGANELRDAAERGAAHLAQNLLPDGRFVYRRSAHTGEPIDGTYDLLGHFGALWAMLDVRGHDPAVQARAATGLQWAIGRYYQQTPDGGAFRRNRWLATGCSGLALLALDELAPEHAPAPDDDVRPELVDFLLANQITSGGLRHDFPHKIALRRIRVDLASNDVSISPQIAPYRSIHYTGEILTGLITYLSTLADSFDGHQQRADQDRLGQVYRAVGNAMAALMARRHGVKQHSQWTMYAIRRFAELTDRLLAAGGLGADEPARRGRRDLVVWASRIAAGMLESPLDGYDTRTVPIAGRVQAHVQYLDLTDAFAAEATSFGGLIDSVRRQAEQDCAVLLRRQDRSTGGFVGSPEEPIMQIDDTQHATSALLGAASAIGQ